MILDLDAADRYADGTLGARLRDFYRATGFNQVSFAAASCRRTTISTTRWSGR
ncbi:MAG: hypothetical protein R3E53_08965 [Myxococcota bacterium]